MKAARGFTLLELLASMALMALLMLGIWSGIDTVNRTAEKGRDRANLIDRSRGAGTFLRHDLAHASPIPWDEDDRGRSIVFSGDAHAMHFVAPLPGYLGRLGPQLQSLQLVPDGNGHWRLQIAFALLPPDGSKPRPFGKPEVLLENIVRGQFSYRGFNIERKDTGWNDHWHHAITMPRLVRIELELANGSWPTLTAPLRIDASAVNRAAIRASAWRGGQP